MNPPPSHGATAIVQQPIAQTDREVPAQDVLRGTGVSANVAAQLSPQCGDNPDAPLSLETVLKQMEQFRTRSLAENTVRGYESDWRDFEAWCGRQNWSALPADVDTLCLYLVDCAQRLTKATLDRRIAAIARRRKVAGYPNPTAEAKFREVMPGVKRMKKQAQRAKRPLLSEELREILEQLDPETAQGSRDRALLLIGFTGALRRFEFVSLDVEDYSLDATGNDHQHPLIQDGPGREGK